MSTGLDEKTDAEKNVSTEHVESLEDPDMEFGGKEERAKLEKGLLLKLDMRMSVLVVIYIMNYIDRNNAGAARLRGFEHDLQLEGQQFPTVLSILFVGYCLMQIPSNLLLNYLGRPSIYLPACITLWGLISVLTGVTKNYAGVLAARLFLGFVEAAFFPGAIFLLSKWYKRNEVGYRTSILYTGNLVSNAFGGLLAAGIISGMQGVLGHAAWRWLYYIEGAMTILTALLAIFILPDFPSNTKWLTPLERKLAEKRMREDAGGADDEDDGGALRGFVLAITDWKVWWFATALTAQLVALSFNIYFPTLTATLGFSTTVTLLLVAPPWAFAAFVSFLLNRHSDNTNERFYHIAGSHALGIVGFIMAIATQNVAARYVSLFLMSQAYSGLVCSYAWMSNSFPRPTYKRAAALALMNAVSNAGNIPGSYIWPSMWGPSYRNSFWICFSSSILAIIMCFIFKLTLQRLNKKLQEGDWDGGVLGKDFRYTV